MLGNWEAFFYLSGWWRVQGNHWKTQGRSWRHRWRWLCLVSWRRRSVPTSRGKPTTKPKVPIKSKRQSMHASWRPAWQLTKVKSKKVVILEAHRKEKNRPFCFFDGHLSSRKCRVGAEGPKVQRPGRLPRWQCHRWFRIVCSVRRARFVCIPNDGRESDGCHRKQDYLTVMDKQPTQYPLTLK